MKDTQYPVCISLCLYFAYNDFVILSFASRTVNYLSKTDILGFIAEHGAGSLLV